MVQFVPTDGIVPCVSGGQEYQYVPANSSSPVILGSVGAAGDYLEGLIFIVATAASSQVTLADGNATAITILPNAVGGGVGSQYLPLGIRAKVVTTPGWRITTAAGVSVLACGVFT